MSKQGGARAGAGRKSIDPAERKQQIAFYVKKKDATIIKDAINKFLKLFESGTIEDPQVAISNLEIKTPKINITGKTKTPLTRCRTSTRRK